MSPALLWSYFIRGLIGLPLVGLMLLGDCAEKLWHRVEPYLPKAPL